MSKLKKNKALTESITFYSFIILVISVPFIFWKGFYNGFDLIKFSAIKVFGGVFIILVVTRFIVESKHQSINLKLEKTLDPLMFFFLIAAAVSTIFSQNQYVSFKGNYETQIGLQLYLFLFIIYFILPYVINRENKVRAILVILEASAVVVALFSIIQYFGINPFHLKPGGFKRPVSTVGYPVFTAGFLALIFPFSVLNITRKKGLLLKIVFPLILIFGIISTQTRTTYAALAVEVIVILLLFPFAKSPGRGSAKRYLKYSLGLLFVFVMLVAVTIIIFPENVFVKRFLSIGRITELPRWYLWRDSMRMFLHYPVTGTGISMFSRVFDFYSSYQLRFADIEGVFINAHNNYINTLCTMGLLGGIAYLAVLFQVLRLSVMNTFSSKKTGDRVFFLASAGFISGYMVYGLADFDDITILFLFFIVLALFKIKLTDITNGKNIFDRAVLKRPIVVISAVIISLFSFYGVYSTYDIISAESKYSAGIEKYNSNDFQGFLNDLSTAVEINPGESYYKYNFASYTNVYCSGLGAGSEKIKNDLLHKAMKQVKDAEGDYRSKLECLTLESLIQLQLGNEEEGFRLKDELFKTDTTRFSYRINLGVYYLNRGRDEDAIKEINAVLNWDFTNINALTVKTLYYLRQKNYDEAENICKDILRLAPANKFAKETLKEIKSSK